MSLDRLPPVSIEDDDRSSSPPSSPTSSSDSETYLVGFIIAKIVGLQYYSGRITGREMVGLVREPLNPHDSNAIKVFDTRNIQVGHIEKKVASVLAPLLDSNLIHLEGIVPKTSNNIYLYKIPCHVHVFAKIEAFETVKSAFLGTGLVLLSENNPLFNISESMVVKEKKRGDLDEIFKLVDENLSQNAVKGEIQPPKDLILPDLLTHQKEGLYWLYHRENSDELPPFWEEKNDVFVNVLTNYETDQRPDPLRGGIFADDMGLGKTLTLLSLIALDRCNVSNDGRSELKEVNTEPLVSLNCMRSRKGSKKQKTEEYMGRVDSNPKMTLIVCPPSVFSAWITQLTEHTKRGMLKAYIYHGARTKDVLELEKYDIILTTYSTLASELSVTNSPMEKIEWWRVILDEAHIIKNHKSKQSIAVTQLNSKRRWVVTGTPIQNSSTDLYSLMAFLRFEPFSTKCYWHRLVQRPISQQTPNGLSRLQALMATISLRRTKEKVLTGLPKKTIHICTVELSLEERKLYDEMEAEGRESMQRYLLSRSVTNNYSTLLSIILRLRQLCTHTALCPSDYKTSLLSSNFEDAANKPKLLEKLVLMLQDSDDLDCPICLSPPSKIIITSCAHIFCEPCIIQALNNSISTCSLCRKPLSKSDLFSPPPEYTPEADNTTCKPSSKTNALLHFLNTSRNEDPCIKSVVFSQFRKLLILLQEPLKEAGFKTLRLDGEMTAKKRANVIKEFGLSGPDSNEPMVLLASLKAAGTGINLTAASRVYLMEPWWNPAIEEQAMDRVHRIGQSKEVKVVKMIAKDSIDERILKLQEKKERLANEAFGIKAKDWSDLCALLSLRK